MHPVLVEGYLNSYGTLITLGGLGILPGLLWDARRRRIPAELLLDFYIVLVVGCFVGGRLLDILSRPQVFLADPTRIFSLQDAFVFYGSLLGVFVGFIALARRYRRPLAEICDLLAPYIGFGHALGRVGCFLAGCCWGATVTGDPAWSAHFPPGSIVFDAAEIAHRGGTTVGLHPVQLYEAAGLALMAVFLVVVRVRRGIEAPWKSSARYALAYGLLRIATELFRGDASRGLLFTGQSPTLARWLHLPLDQPFLLSTSQTISLALLAWGLWILGRPGRAPALSSAQRP